MQCGTALHTHGAEMPLFLLPCQPWSTLDHLIASLLMLSRCILPGMKHGLLPVSSARQSERGTKTLFDHEQQATRSFAS